MSDLGAVSATSHPSAKENTADIIRKVAWRLMPLIMLCYLFAFFDRINISFAKFALKRASAAPTRKSAASARPPSTPWPGPC